MIALFLAVLEMVRMQAVVVTQKDLFGEIALQRHAGFDAVFASDQPIAAIEKDYI
jgi:segregation and condensation protein A